MLYSEHISIIETDMRLKQRWSLSRLFRWWLLQYPSTNGYRSSQVIVGPPVLDCSTSALCTSSSLHCYQYSREIFFTSDVLVLTHSPTFLRYRTTLQIHVDQEHLFPIRMVWCIGTYIARYCPFSVRLSRNGWYSSDRTATNRYSVSRSCFNWRLFPGRLT